MCVRLLHQTSTDRQLQLPPSNPDSVPMRWPGTLSAFVSHLCCCSAQNPAGWRPYMSSCAYPVQAELIGKELRRNSTCQHMCATMFCCLPYCVASFARMCPLPIPCHDTAHTLTHTHLTGCVPHVTHHWDGKCTAGVLFPSMPAVGMTPRDCVAAALLAWQVTE